MLRVEKPPEDILKQVAVRACEEIKPISDVRVSSDFRKTLSRILVEQALKEAVAIVFA